MTGVKKTAVALLIVSMVGLTASSMVQARGSGSDQKRGGHEFELEDHGQRGRDRVKINIEGEHGVLSGLGLGDNAAVKAARDTFKTAVQNAKITFKAAVKTAREKLNTAVTAAGTDVNARLTAVRTYLSEVLAARQQKQTAQNTAMQAFINALASIRL